MILKEKPRYNNLDNSSNSGSCEPATFAGRKGGFSVKGLMAWYGRFLALKDITIDIPPKAVTAIIGPSGCGKSTFIRCLNRMHEVAPGARVAGEACLDGDNIYDKLADPVAVRRRVGMVFQKPNPFPIMSVYENAAAGLKLARLHTRHGELDEIVEQSLIQAALWDEVKDKLHQSGASLSGGQQQRLLSLIHI